MAPLQLVELLNSIFTAIDGVVEACANVPEEAGVHKGAGQAGRGGGEGGGAGRGWGREGAACVLSEGALSVRSGMM